jgi:hypothetical protein
MSKELDEAFEHDLTKLAEPSAVRAAGLSAEKKAGEGAQVVERPEGPKPNAVITQQFKKKFFGKGYKPSGLSVTRAGVYTPAAASKEAGLDARFTRDLCQAVGVDVPEARPDFQRPDVHVDGRVEDRIDDHYLAWMREHADHDVVKVATKFKPAGRLAQIARNITQQHEVEPALKALRSEGRRGAAKGALGALGVAGTALGLKKLHDDGKRRGAAGVYDQEDGEKMAAINADPENAELLARVQKRAKETMIQVGSEDV